MLNIANYSSGVSELYQKLKAIGFRNDLPERLHVVFDQLCAAEAEVDAENDIVIDASSHAAFAFIRVKPVRLDEPALLFAESVPTRQIQEVSLCRARWDDVNQEWLPDENNPIFIAQISAVSFSDAVMGDDVRMSPMTFVNLHKSPVPASHEPLSVSFLLDWASKQSSAYTEIINSLDKTEQFKELLAAGTDVTQLKKVFSTLGVERLAQNDPSSFARNMMHEVMGKVSKHLRAEVINDVCRATTAATVNGSVALLQDMRVDDSAPAYHDTDIVRMRSFYALYLDDNNMEAQFEIMQLVTENVAAMSSIGSSNIQNKQDFINHKLKKMARRTKEKSPLGESHYVQPALSAGCVEISKHVGGRMNFFGAQNNFEYAVEMSFGFAYAEVDCYGSVTTRRPYVPNARVSLTSSQFVELLQSSQIGTWTKCTLVRAGINDVPFPKSHNATHDGRLSQRDVEFFPEQQQLQELMGLLRGLLMKKPFNAACREQMNSALCQVTETLKAFQERLNGDIESSKSDVVNEHRQRLEKSLTEILRMSDQLSLSAPQRIHDSVSLLTKD